MLIYLDSSDLINLCKGEACISLSELAGWLKRESHEVEFSFETLVELSDRLRSGEILEVRKELNSLEQLPHRFINEGRVYHEELLEGISAFDEGREYRFQAVAPFSARLDETLDLYGKPQHIFDGGIFVPTAAIVNYTMSDCILDLWRREPLAFDVQRRREADWKRMMAADRALANPPSFEDNFVKKDSWRPAVAPNQLFD